MEDSATVVTNILSDGTIISNLENTGAQITSDIIVGGGGGGGSQGPPGQGVPSGGTTGQYLRKSTSAPYDDAWSNISEGDVSNLVTDLAARLRANQNLSDVTNAAAARSNLGLGSMSTQNAGSVAIGGGTITGMPSPSASGDVANKAYVDGIAAGLQVKTACLCGTVSALPANTYNNGTGGIGATLTANSNGALTVDGVSPSLNDRVLVKNESTQANNGIYYLSQVGDGSHPYILTRTSDMDTNAQISGAFTFIESGTVNTGTGFVVVPPGPYTIGTTAIIWTQFTAAGNITAGTGLTLTGGVMNLNPATSSALGGIELTGALGGTATAPTTPTAVHITGNETIGGTKTFSNAPVVPSSSFPESAITNLTSDLALLAPLNSPAFTGTPTAPTPTTGDNTTNLATTAFVSNAIIDGGSA